MIDKADIAIVGAGVAGCATAIALQNSSPELNVVLIDADSVSSGTASIDQYKQSVRPKIGETLPPQVIVPLQKLGIWPQFKASGFAESSATSAAWGQQRTHANEYIYSPYGNGWHLNREEFDSMIKDIAVQGGAQILEATKLRGITGGLDATGGEARLLELESQNTGKEMHTLSVGFIVDATGRAARVAQRLGVSKRKFDDLVGIYQFYQPRPVDGQAVNSGALVEATDNGWWYSANLPTGQTVVALMTDADVARSMRYRSASQFSKALALTEHTGARIDAHQSIAPPIVTAAHTQCLTQIAGRGWLAVGDSAFTFDPLSSLGIFKALRMSILASYAIKDYFYALGKASIESLDNKSESDLNLAKYQHLGFSEFDQYLLKRADYYAQEQRFSKSLFWQRRLAA